MAYSDLHFNNIQLMKLVSSAEILFQHLYELVSAENKSFIDQWFCYKQEYDETCTDNPQFDVNENVQESSALARIDEVSENEKMSSVSSVSTESSTHSEETDRSIESMSDSNGKTDAESECADTTRKTANLSKVDSDLLDYMTDFKLTFDNNISDWFKTLYFNMSDIKQYMSWLESDDHTRIWTDIITNAHQKSVLGKVKYGGFQSILDKAKEGIPEWSFIPIQTSHGSSNQAAELSNILKSAEVSNKLKPTEVSNKLKPTEVSTKLKRNPKNYANNLNLQEHVHQEEIVDQQIRYLQEIRKVLVYLKQEANLRIKNKVQNDTACHAEFPSVHKIDVAFDLIDLSIEMKNQLKLGRDIRDLVTFNDKVETVVDDCLRVLTLNEIRHLLFTYLSSVVTMRKCSSEHDKQLTDLDREISNQKFLIWRLYMIINENKRSYEKRCLTLHEEFQQKMQLLGKTTTDESNDESVAGVADRALLPIMEKNSLHESTQSESRDVQNAMSCVPHIPEKNLKMLQSTSASSSTKVKRNKKKLIITAQKH